ncbi:MAG: tRNA lysidine(34) synthetase TilS [Daejeonella sp.]
MIEPKRLSAFIKQHALFVPGERILLAVSGGRDSVLMAHLFKNEGFNFGIAHCNFNMRGEESKQDERFTAKLAKELDVPYYTKGFDTKGYSLEHHISIQMAARDLRYQWLEQIRSEEGFNYVAVAHHQNDVIETMLLNLTRGTGIAGMHGILPNSGKLIRPLLAFTRDEIDELVHNLAIAYRDDSSNESTKYARNKIRLDVIPALKAINPSLEQTFEANRKRFAELEILLNIHVEERRKVLFKKLNEEEFEIDLPGLKGLHPIDTLLYELFKPYGFTDAVLHDLSSSWDGHSGKTFSSLFYDLNLDRNRLILIRKKINFDCDILIKENRSLLNWNDKKFRSDVISLADLHLRKDAAVAQLDIDLLTFPLILRKWKPGDHFYPLGLKGKQKLSDLFIQQKVPLNRKNDIGVLENGNGDILWVCGLRIDDRYKITAGTKKVFIFEQLN